MGKKVGNRLEFFMSATSPMGFASYFGTLTDPAHGYKTYILGTPPAVDKTALLREIGEMMLQRGEDVQFLLCSRDPNRLDGLIIDSKKLAVISGEAPHNRLPQYPGAVEEYIDFFGSLNADKLLQNREKIVELTDQINDLQRRSGKFLSAATSLLRDSSSIVSRCIDKSKIDRYVTSTLRRQFPETGKTGRAHKRFLSIVGPDGYQTLLETAQNAGDKIFVLEDSHQTASSYLLGQVQDIAVAAGYEVYSCYAPLFPYHKIEHLLIPELSIVFLTQKRQNAFAEVIDDPFRRIYSRRFTDLDAQFNYRNRLSFNKRASKELIGEAVKLQSSARECTKELEELYTPAIDEQQVALQGQRLMAEILAL